MAKLQQNHANLAHGIQYPVLFGPFGWPVGEAVTEMLRKRTSNKHRVCPQAHAPLGSLHV